MTPALQCGITRRRRRCSRVKEVAHLHALVSLAFSISLLSLPFLAALSHYHSFPFAERHRRTSYVE